MGYQKLTKSFVQQLGSVGKPGNNNNALAITLTEIVALWWSNLLDKRSDSSDDESSSLLFRTLFFFTGAALLVGIFLFGDFGHAMTFKKEQNALAKLQILQYFLWIFKWNLFRQINFTADLLYEL